MTEIIKMIIANIKANIWCLFHFGDVVLWKYSDGGKTVNIEVGNGSIFKNTWKTKRVFYSCNKTTEGN